MANPLALTQRRWAEANGAAAGREVPVPHVPAG